MKNELEMFEKKEQAVVSSKVIAEKFEKQHKDVLESIRNLMAENSVVKTMFLKSRYEVRGRWFPEFLVTRDGFTLLAMGFTGKKALEWKLKYLEAFNYMEALIKERLTTDWLVTRKQGKLVRRQETDALAELIHYAEAQGSTNMQRQAYRLYSKLVNTLVGIEKGERDKVDFKTLSTIMFLEDMISHTIVEEMEKGTHYKNIYQLCKSNGMQIIRFAYLPRASA